MAWDKNYIKVNAPQFVVIMHILQCTLAAPEMVRRDAKNDCLRHNSFFRYPGYRSSPVEDARRSIDTTGKGHGHNSHFVGSVYIGSGFRFDHLSCNSDVHAYEIRITFA